MSLPRAVAEAEITCQSAPWQAEGRLWDGPIFYLRIRSEVASLGFGSTLDEAIDDAIDGTRSTCACDHHVPWVPTDDEAWALFDVLLAMKP